MDKNIATADLLQENSVGGVVEKAGIVPGNATLKEENKTQNTVLNTGFAAAKR